MFKKVRGIIIAAVIGIFGFATLSYAGWGYGCGDGMGQYSRGPGWHHRGGNGYPMGGAYANLSEEEIARLDQQRSEFFNATEDIQGQLNEKELALRREVAKENPDATMASNLHRDISKLQSELDQKQLEFDIKTRKAIPGYNRSFRGDGPMMGNGMRGNGSCMW